MLMHKVKALIKKVPGIFSSYIAIHHCLRLLYFLVSGNFRSLYYAPPGHFYSPHPNIKEILKRSGKVFNSDSKNCPGINLQEKSQLDLLNQLSIYYDDLSFPERPNNSTRYYYQNGWFGYAEVIILYSLMRHFRPQRVIEIGSGFSSAAMLDIDDLFLNNSVDFTFIEPFPERLISLLGEQDRRRHTVIQKPLQQVSHELFQSLSKNDILFIDSTHVVKRGSDVAEIFFNILPALKAGVLIHFHDIFWPFEYPKEWLREGRAWNESYFLRTFLQFNNTFEIVYFNSFMGMFHADIISDKLPLCLKDTGASIWIKKIA
jgi:hypothetical protein